MNRRIWFICLAVAGVAALAACGQATTSGEPVEVTRVVTQPVEVTRVVEVKPAGGVPYEELWKESGHNAVDGEPFRHWDDAAANPDGVPTSCAKCHTTAGYQDYLGADGSEALKVDKPVPAADSQGIQCVACHNPVASFQLNSVQFPGKDAEGNPITVTGLGDSARCMICHQGRESKASVDGAIAQFKVEDVDAVVAPIKDDKGNDVKFGFRNIHYFAAAATQYGTQVKGGYEYDGQSYDYKHAHVAGYDTCAGCHDPHSLKVKVDECTACHAGVTSVEDLKNIRMAQASSSDYNGNGDTTEGMYYEIQGLQEQLLAAIQTYAQEKTGTAISYDAATYPYFLGPDGKAFPAWTARLLKAAYNYQLSVKDTGAYAHGNKYVVQLLYDSIQDLGGDVSKLARNDSAHFAGNTMPFRDWDETGEVPFGCAKCHSASGLPQFIHNGGTVTFNSRGSTYVAGVGAQPVSNGFMCTTCHNPATFAPASEADGANARIAVTSVPFPSGKSLTFSVKDADGKLVPNDSNLCLECHQGRESGGSVRAYLAGRDADKVDANINFKNVHYFASGATLFGSDAGGMFEYTGQKYNGRFLHKASVAGPNECVQCHDAHTLEVQVDKCSQCHTVATEADLKLIGVQDVDYNGNGKKASEEGIHAEFVTFQERLLAAIQKYATAKAEMGILYDGSAYPYFFQDKDGDGQPDKNDKGATLAFTGFWTPRLLQAAYNYQYSVKDPGAFAHNSRYVMQALYDSIKDLGGDVTGLTRPAVTTGE